MASRSTAEKVLGVVAALALVASVLFAALVALFGWNAAHVPCEAPVQSAMDANGRQAILVVAIAHGIFAIPALAQLLMPSSLGLRIGALVCAICASVGVFVAFCFLIFQAGMC